MKILNVLLSLFFLGGMMHAAGVDLRVAALSQESQSFYQSFSVAADSEQLAALIPHLQEIDRLGREHPQTLRVPRCNLNVQEWLQERKRVATMPVFGGPQPSVAYQTFYAQAAERERQEREAAEYAESDRESVDATEHPGTGPLLSAQASAFAVPQPPLFSQEDLNKTTIKLLATPLLPVLQAVYDSEARGLSLAKRYELYKALKEVQHFKEFLALSTNPDLAPLKVMIADVSDDMVLEATVRADAISISPYGLGGDALEKMRAALQEIAEEKQDNEGKFRHSEAQEFIGTIGAPYLEGALRGGSLQEVEDKREEIKALYQAAQEKNDADLTVEDHRRIDSLAQEQLETEILMSDALASKNGAAIKEIAEVNQRLIDLEAAHCQLDFAEKRAATQAAREAIAEFEKGGKKATLTDRLAAYEAACKEIVDRIFDEHGNQRASYTQPSILENKADAELIQVAQTALTESNKKLLTAGSSNRSSSAQSWLQKNALLVGSLTGTGIAVTALATVIAKYNQEKPVNARGEAVSFRQYLVDEFKNSFWLKCAAVTAVGAVGVGVYYKYWGATAAA